MKTRNIVVLLYLFIAIFTFGHGAGNFECEMDTRKKPCAGDTAIISAIGALFWPLYWSWEIQK